MGSWDETRQETTGPGGTGGDFFKLQDNETATIAIVGEPETYIAKPFNDGDSPKKRVLLNVLLLKDKTLKIMDASTATFQELCELRDKFSFDRYSVSIKRKGTGKATRYTILPDKEFNDQQRAYLSGLKLADLDELAGRIQYEGNEPRASYPRPPEPKRQDSQPQTVQQAMVLKDEEIPF